MILLTSLVVYSTDIFIVSELCIPERQMMCSKGKIVEGGAKVIYNACIPLTYVCDGISDCMDGADELMCKYDRKY